MLKNLNQHKYQRWPRCVTVTSGCDSVCIFIMTTGGAVALDYTKQSALRRLLKAINVM